MRARFSLSEMRSHARNSAMVSPTMSASWAPLVRRPTTYVSVMPPTGTSPKSSLGLLGYC